MTRARIVVVAVSLGLLGAGCYQNGRFDPSALTVITPSCSVVHDLAGRLTDMINAAHADGVAAHAAAYGFVHPAWAEPGGSSPEPWHWEG